MSDDTGYDPRDHQVGMFPDATPADVQIGDIIHELERELKVRREVFPRWISTGRISREDAHRRIIVMERILADYKQREEDMNHASPGD